MVDGVDMGESPVVVERTTGTQGKLRVQAEMDSFEVTRVEVARSEWFLWPALLAIVPTLGLTVVWIPIAGPIIAVGWAVATSPTLLGLAFLRRYPDEVVVELKPRVSVIDGGLLPTDAWTVPEEYAPNPVPLPPGERDDAKKKRKDKARPVEEDAQPLPLPPDDEASSERTPPPE
jgi:hypothetical protein